MVNNMVFRWPKPLFCPGFGAHGILIGVDDFSGPPSKGQNPSIFPMSTQIYRGKSGTSKSIRGKTAMGNPQRSSQIPAFWWSHLAVRKDPEKKPFERRCFSLLNIWNPQKKFQRLAIGYK